MRIIEAKNILDRVVNENKQVVIENQPGFNNAVFSISKMDDYIDFLYFIASLSFSDLKKEEIDQLGFVQEKRNMLGQEEFNSLNSLIGKANINLPMVYSVLDSFAEKQDSKLVNIKIPEKVKTLIELFAFNKKIEDLFKKFDYGNDKNNIIFSGVDKGTAWLEIIINNPSLHIDFTLSLSLALHFVQHWNNHKGSDVYNLTFNIFSKNSESKTEKDYEEVYKTVFFETELTKKEVKEKIQLNGREQTEKINSIILGARSIIELMEEGSELRISYNPPEYIQDGKNFFEINYSKLPKIESKKVEEKKKDVLEQPKIQDSSTETN